MFIGIPVLNRLDLLERCLSAVDEPADIVIVNNNSVDAEFRDRLAALCRRYGAELLQQERNLGVAASWNLLARTAFERGRERLFIGSNDTFLRPGSLAAATAQLKEPAVGVWHLHAWNFFLIRRSTIGDVGWFDENFYPAYKEDQDYSYRCILAGVSRVDVPGAGAEHLGSATANSDETYRAANVRTHFGWNRNYYVLKWGGDATAEHYRTPFDAPDRDHRWWPDPGDSIAARDWDRARRGPRLQRAAPERLFKHSGKLGDLIYALPTVRALGGGTILLRGPGPGFAGEALDAEMRRVVTPLLRMQSYVRDVAAYTGREKVIDLDQFRRPGPCANLADRHLYWFGLPFSERDRAWIEVDRAEVMPGKPVIIHRSPWYHNPRFPWKRVMEKYGAAAGFVGLPAEHAAFELEFGPIDYRPTADLAELARLIAGCRLFIGNQSAPYAIAEGLKANTIQETDPRWRNCIFERPNAIHSQDENVALPNCESGERAQ